MSIVLDELRYQELTVYTCITYFIIDEVERLEKELEAGEAKIRRLEEDHNRSQQEKHHLSATEDDLRKREKNYNQRVQELERELETKTEIVSC